jgi:hypothetical protein
MITYKNITFAFKDHRQLKRHLLYMFARRMGLKYAARRNYTIKRIWKIIGSEIETIWDEYNGIAWALEYHK